LIKLNKLVINPGRNKSFICNLYVIGGNILEKVLYQYHFNFLGFLPLFIPLGLGLFSFFFWKINNRARVIGLIGGSFCILLFMVSTSTYIYKYFNVKHKIDTNNVKIVEGYVKKYHPMPYEGHEDEHFTINGVYFEYSDFEIINGYNKSASHGGVITHNGQHLKIKYYKDSSDINEIVYIAQISP